MDAWVARQDLAEIRAELGPGVRTFLADNADGIREWFAEEFGRAYPEFARDFNRVQEWPEDRPVELWDLVFVDPEGTRYTVRQLFDQVLRPVADHERIGQDVLEIHRADSGGWTGGVAASGACCRWWCWNCGSWAGPGTIRASGRSCTAWSIIR